MIEVVWTWGKLPPEAFAVRELPFVCCAQAGRLCCSQLTNGHPGGECTKYLRLLSQSQIAIGLATLVVLAGSSGTSEPRPQVTQKRQFTSSSVLQAGH